MYLLRWIAWLWKTEFAMDVWITKDGYSSSSFISAILIQVINMSHNIGTSIRHEWSSTGPHCVNVVTVTVKYFKMRVRIYSTDAMDDKIPRSSLSVCAYCKWSKTGGVENLGMRLGVIYWSIWRFQQRLDCTMSWSILHCKRHGVYGDALISADDGGWRDSVELWWPVPRQSCKTCLNCDRRIRNVLWVRL